MTHRRLARFGIAGCAVAGAAAPAPTAIADLDVPEYVSLARQGLQSRTYHPFGDVAGVRVFDITLEDWALGKRIHFIVKGGDGGNQDGRCAFGIDFAWGGRGAMAVFEAPIGISETNVQPGGTLRYIPGAMGTNDEFEQEVGDHGGDGGGGSAVLYCPPGLDLNDPFSWEILAVAGAGGGGFIKGFGVACGVFTGKAASLTRNGADGDGRNGGDGGQGGLPGGGEEPGDGIPLRFPWPTRQGNSEFNGEGFGAGGIGDRTWSGGGGGYSGGGAGKEQRAGGGGSFINSDRLINRSLALRDDDRSDGRIVVEVTSDNDNHNRAIGFEIGDEIPVSPSFATASMSGVCGESEFADLWYETTNHAECGQTLSVTWVGGGEVSFHVEGAIGTPVACGSDGLASVNLQPGESILVRIATNGNRVFTTFSEPIDTDGDGVCDTQDVCPTGDDTTDCNENGIPDCAEDFANTTTVLQDFTDPDSSGHPVNVNGDARAEDNRGKLTRGVGGPGQVGTFTFQRPQAPLIADDWEVSFDFLMREGAHGISFAALDERLDELSIVGGSEGFEFVNAPIHVTLDTFINPGEDSDNQVEVDGLYMPDASYEPDFQLDSGQWHNLRVTYTRDNDSARCVVTLTPHDGEPVLVADVTGGAFDTPFFFAVGASCADAVVHWIDNVTITDLNNGSDCDFDGIPDPCDSEGCEPPINDDCENAIGVLEGDTSFDAEFSDGDIWFRYVIPDNICDGEQIFFRGDGTQEVYDACDGNRINVGGDNGYVTLDQVNPGQDVFVRVVAASTGTLNIFRFAGGDTDGDGVGNTCDNCVHAANPDQIDDNGDGIGDACQPANDVCATALPLAFEGADTIDVRFDTRTSTEFVHYDNCNPITSDDFDLWYTVTATADGPVTFSSLTVDNGFSPASLMVFDACEGTELGCTSSDEGTLEILAAAGQTLIVRIGSTYDSRGEELTSPATGSFTVSLNDQDGDGVTDADDICPNFPDQIDSDGDGIPDGCEASCAADWDENGTVNAADVGAFLSQYFENLADGGLQADFDNNGVVNAADVGAFLSQYFDDLTNPDCNGG